MRRIGLILLMAGAVTFAEEEPPPDDTPPPPRIMEIHMKINMKDTIDRVFCGQIDPDIGITFISDGLHGLQMKVNIIELDSTLQPIMIKDPVSGYSIPLMGTRYYYASQIDSITFPLFLPPAQ
jgi:hypothetical protein